MSIALHTAQDTDAGGAFSPPDGARGAGIEWLVAGSVFALGLVLYVRTLAPGLLLGDSAEFQTLAYTLGMAHNTGYAVYLLLGKLLTLLPVNEVAWRVNLLSAICAAAALAEVYLLARITSGRRIFALMAAGALSINYLFWWQSVISEVYTPAAAFLMGVLLLTVWWSRTRRSNLLFAAGLTGGLAFGVHALVGLIVPVVFVFMLISGASRRDWVMASAGALLGLMLTAGAFLLLDARNDPTSIIHTFRAHANAYGLQRSEFDSARTRIGFIVFARQWRDQVLRSSPAEMLAASRSYESATVRTFGPVAVALMAAGAARLLVRPPRNEGLLLVGSWLVVFVYVTNYHIGDIQVFYVPTYALLAVFLACGLALIEDAFIGFAARQGVGRRTVAVGVPIVLLVVMLASLAPRAEDVKRSVSSGRISFLRAEDARWPYPVNDPDAPHRQAGQLAAMIEEPDALVFLDWGMLYPFCYVAHVEQGRAATGCMETMPYGTNGRVTDSLRETLREETAHRAVYFGRVVPELTRDYIFAPVQGPVELYRVERR